MADRDRAHSLIDAGRFDSTSLTERQSDGRWGQGSHERTEAGHDGLFAMRRAVIDAGLAHAVGPVEEIVSSIARFVPMEGS